MKMSNENISPLQSWEGVKYSVSFPCPCFSQCPQADFGSSPLHTGQTTREPEGAVAVYPHPASESPLAAAKYSPEDSVSLQSVFRDLDGIVSLFKWGSKKPALGSKHTWAAEECWPGSSFCSCSPGWWHHPPVSYTTSGLCLVHCLPYILAQWY